MFRVITKDDARELISEHRGVSGARAKVATALVDRAQQALHAQTVTARTFPLVRGEIDQLLAGVALALAWDGPTQIEAADVTYTIEQVANAPTQGEKKAAKASDKTARWLGVKYANTCGTCKRRVEQGEQAFYEYATRTLYCSNGCGEARETALKTNDLLGRAA